MKFMVVYVNATMFAAVGRNRKVLEIWKARFKTIDAWRYDDGTGWVDGSPDAWKVITQVPNLVEVAW